MPIQKENRRYHGPNPPKIKSTVKQINPEESMEPKEPTKKCPKCGRELPISEFHKASKKKDGLQVYCKDCTREYNHSYHEEMVKKLNKPAKTESKESSLLAYSTEDLKKALMGRGNVVLVNPTPRELMLELKKKGWDGELSYKRTIVDTVSLANIK